MANAIETPRNGNENIPGFMHETHTNYQSNWLWFWYVISAKSHTEIYLKLCVEYMRLYFCCSSVCVYDLYVNDLSR